MCSGEAVGTQLIPGCSPDCRLTAAKVLVVGLGKLAAEVGAVLGSRRARMLLDARDPPCPAAAPVLQIAKNIVLAGVGNVALLDDRPASGFMGDSFLVSTATPAGIRQGGLLPLRAPRPACRAH